MGSKYDSAAATDLKQQTKKYKDEMNASLGDLYSAIQTLYGSFASDASMAKHIRNLTLCYTSIKSSLDNLDSVEKGVDARMAAMEAYENT